MCPSFDIRVSHLQCLTFADIASGDLNLLKFIELLGPGIAGASDDDRYRATDLLSIVLHSLGPISPDEGEICKSVELYHHPQYSSYVVDAL